MDVEWRALTHLEEVGRHELSVGDENHPVRCVVAESRTGFV